MKKQHCATIEETLRITTDLLMKGYSVQIKQYAPDSIWIDPFKCTQPHPDASAMMPFVNFDGYTDYRN